MITFIDYQNLQLNAEAYQSHFKLRYECFISRQRYDVSQWREMEFDTYDNPAAVYLVYESPSGEAWGSARLTPVRQNSMLRDLWPELVDHAETAFDDAAWEGTRFCIKKDLPVIQRTKIRNELALAHVEAGLHLGATQIIGVMPPLIFKRVFIGAGADYRYLGKPLTLPSGEEIIGASISVSWEALTGMRQKTGIPQNIIVNRSPNFLLQKSA